MVKLFCAMMDTEGSAFPVDIDAGQTVGDLKKAIADELKYTGRADQLQLFLAKKGEGCGAWVTEEEAMSGVGDTTDLKLLGAARARLRRVGLSDKDVGGVDEEEEAEGRGPVNVLVVVPDLQQAASIKKQLRYKGMSTEASCRKFLDALAQKLAVLYDFECSYGGVPTIGDVFNAVRTKDWGFRLKRGKQLTDVELPEYFTEDEWNDLKDLNLRTNRRIHDGKVPTTSKGKSYIILPHVLFTDGRVDRYKGIATKASMVWEPTELEVKDEDEFSGSSRSSSGRSDGAWFHCGSSSY